MSTAKYDYIDEFHLNTNVGAYFMDEDESERWGAYEDDGVEAEDLGEFRRGLKKELQAIADEHDKSIGIYADGDGIGAQDWLCTVLEPYRD